MAADRLIVIGWQFRFAYPTHRGPWHNVLSLPRTIENGAPVSGSTDCHFEVREVYALPDGVTGTQGDKHGL